MATMNVPTPAASPTHAPVPSPGFLDTTLKVALLLYLGWSVARSAQEAPPVVNPPIVNPPVVNPPGPKPPVVDPPGPRPPDPTPSPTLSPLAQAQQAYFQEVIDAYQSKGTTLSKMPATGLAPLTDVYGPFNAANDKFSGVFQATIEQYSDPQKGGVTQPQALGKVFLDVARQLQAKAPTR